MSRRLNEEEAAAVLASASPIAPAADPRRCVTRCLEGRDRDGGPRRVDLTGATLVLFLSTRCGACADLADLVRDAPAGVRVLGVLRPPAPEAVAEVAAYTVGGGDWLVGDHPFAALEVRAAPFFCVLDDVTLLVEGVAFGREQVERHVALALAGRPEPDAVRLRPRR